MEFEDKSSLVEALEYDNAVRLFATEKQTMKYPDKDPNLTTVVCFALLGLW